MYFSNSTAVIQAGVILSACLAQIGTLGCKLAIEKDWIIVICGKDKTTLASKYPLGKIIFVDLFVICGK